MDKKKPIKAPIKGINSNSPAINAIKKKFFAFKKYKIKNITIKIYRAANNCPKINFPIVSSIFSSNYFISSLFSFFLLRIFI